MLTKTNPEHCSNALNGVCLLHLSQPVASITTNSTKQQLSLTIITNVQCLPVYQSSSDNLPLYENINLNLQSPVK